MYLYDTNSCGMTVSLRQFKDITLSNKTYGLEILPIRHEPVFINVLTKLSGKTRRYIKGSVCLHVIWMCSAVMLRTFIHIKDLAIFKIMLRIFLYVTTMLIIFDVSMGIVYIAHIQQSLTKAMIIRYSGWGIAPAKVTQTHHFGGWVPLIAAVSWMRGIVFFIINVYICRFTRKVIQKIKGREVKSRLSTFNNVPFPEATTNYDQKNPIDSLYFRAGGYSKF